MTAKPGEEQEPAAFLTPALPLAEAETGTTARFAIRIDDSTSASSNVFPGAPGRLAHLDGPIAAALMVQGK